MKTLSIEEVRLMRELALVTQELSKAAEKVKRTEPDTKQHRVFTLEYNMLLRVYIDYQRALIAVRKG